MTHHPMWSTHLLGTYVEALGPFYDYFDGVLTNLVHMWRRLDYFIIILATCATHGACLFHIWKSLTAKQIFEIVNF
jgi:hypothetical protein